jgi:hypothetical protein
MVRSPQVMAQICRRYHQCRQAHSLNHKMTGQVNNHSVVATSPMQARQI